MLGNTIRNNLVNEMGLISDEMDSLMASGDFNDEKKRKFDTLSLRASTVRAKIRGIDIAASRPPQGAIGRVAGGDEDPQYRPAFMNYLRHGRAELSTEERSVLRWDRAESRDMTTVSGGENFPTGGALVPVGFADEIESALKYYGPMLSGDGSGRDGLPTILDTETGAPLPWPTDNDTTVVGERIAENTTVGAPADVSLGLVNFGAYKYSSKIVKVSIEVLQDSKFPLDTYLGDKLGQRVARVVNTEMTVGTGSGDEMPQGIVAGATLGATAIGAFSNDGVGGLNTIGSDDLISLEHSVDVAYRRNARWMMHDTVLAHLKKLKDKQGRPIWQPGLIAGAPDTILGYQYAVNNDMDQLQTGPNSPVVVRKTLLFGALSKYTVRRVRSFSVLRLSERYADYGQVAFLLFARFDGKLLDAGTHPVKYLQNVY